MMQQLETAVEETYCRVTTVAPDLDKNHAQKRSFYA